jgi:hypothetical protein
MNLLSLVGSRLDNICQIRRKWYYSSGSKNLQTEQALTLKIPSNIPRCEVIDDGINIDLIQLSFLNA